MNFWHGCADREGRLLAPAPPPPPSDAFGFHCSLPPCLDEHYGRSGGRLGKHQHHNFHVSGSGPHCKRWPKAFSNATRARLPRSRHETIRANPNAKATVLASARSVDHFAAALHRKIQETDLGPKAFALTLLRRSERIIKFYTKSGPGILCRRFPAVQNRKSGFAQPGFPGVWFLPQGFQLTLF